MNNRRLQRFRNVERPEVREGIILSNHLELAKMVLPVFGALVRGSGDLQQEKLSLDRFAGDELGHAQHACTAEGGFEHFV